MNLKGRRLLICEEALRDYSGHYYSWVKAIRAIHLAAGADVLVASAMDIRPDIREEMGAIPTYSTNAKAGIYYHRNAWRRYIGVFRHNWLVWRETRALFRKTGPVDCILLPAVRIHHMLAWNVLCRRELGRSFNRFVPFLLNSEAIYDKEFQRFHFKRSSNLLKHALRGLKKFVADGRVVLAGDSHVTCREWETLAGVPFRVFPSPGAGLGAARAGLVKPAMRSSAQPVFTTLGVAFIEKGLDVFQDAILKLLRDDPHFPAKFVIQWTRPIEDWDGRKIVIADTLRRAPQVELIERTIDDDEYRQYFQQADFLVLPYRRKIYFNRISGVAMEAACAGIPMIVTENTWLSWALKEFGAGVDMRDCDAADLAEKIRYCVSQRAELAREAEKRAAVALEKNSSKTYLKCVWE
jgi:glycosyltransferase involved in cell wall biosynthesis